MRIIALVTTVLLGCNALLAATQPIPASSVKWIGPMGTIGPGLAPTETIFCLMMSGTGKPAEHQAALDIALGGSMEAAVGKWLQNHPKAVVVPITNFVPMTRKTSKLKAIYIWVVDGENNLNVDLVRQGFFAPETQSIPETAKLEVSRADYDAFLQKVLEAGKEAKGKKLGIWMEVPQ